MHGTQIQHGLSLSGGAMQRGRYFREQFAGAAGTPRRSELCWGDAGGEASLTRIVRDRARQAEPEELPKVDGFKDGVGTAMQVANSIESFYS